VVLTVAAAVFLGCAVFCTAGQKLVRYKGRALKLEIALFEGEPSPEYIYQSLGKVRGDGKRAFMGTTMDTMFAALEAMAKKAVDMGANAVIMIKPVPEGIDFAYEGEAVIFDKIPEE